MQTVKDRLIYFLSTIPNKKGGIGMTKGAFQVKIGLKSGAIDNIGRSLHSDTVKKIKDQYPNLNEMWLLHGKEPMLLNDQNNNMSAPKEKEPSTEPQTANSTLQQLVQSNLELSRSQRVAMENQTLIAASNDKLAAAILALTNKSIVGESKQDQQDESSKLLVLEKIIVQLGMKTGLFHSELDAVDKMNTLFVDVAKVKKSNRTRGEVGK